MSRHKLEFDPPETDSLLFGICSQYKDYRLAWIINKNFDLSLKRKDDVLLEESARFAFFKYEDYSNRVNFMFLANKNSGNFFLKEYKQVDYFLIIGGNYQSLNHENVLSRLKQTESVLAAYPLSPEIIKSKQHLL